MKRVRRLWAAAEARAIGWGGITHVAEATQTSLDHHQNRFERNRFPSSLPLIGRRPLERLRRPGGGRKPLVDHDPNLLRDLETLVDPVTRGDPMSPLRLDVQKCGQVGDRTPGSRACAKRLPRSTVSSTTWTTASNPIARRSRAKVTRIEMPNSRTSTGESRRSRGRGSPGVGRRHKKALAGQFRNGGREWQPQGQPEEVEVYDFAKRDLGKAIPYGIIYQTTDTGWVSVG